MFPWQQALLLGFDQICQYDELRELRLQGGL
jgi:hypothetical protein